MFEIGGTELLLIAVVALLVIGPKDLPNALRTVGKYTGKARAMTRHLRSGFDEMMRQAELEEMEKQWAEQNRKIMAEHPQQNPPPEGEVAQSAGGVSPEPTTEPTAPQDSLSTPLGERGSAPNAESPTTEQRPLP